MKRNILKLLLSAALLLCCFAAIAAGTQPSAGDGSQANPYQITTADNLVWFAEHVNSGNTTACAKLTADITVNAGVLDSNGNLNSGTFTSWTPIGGFNGGGNDYSGEFNGNGHTISGLYFNDGTKKNVGLFGKTTSGAHIHDLGISDSYFCGKDHVGGICGDFASGRIENCWSEVSIYVTSGDGGGLTGSVFTNAVLKDCYSICNVSGNGSRGLVCGAFYGTIENCYAQNRNSTGTTNAIGWTSGEGPHTATNVEVKDAAAFASGEVCYKLNRGVTDGTQKWYQTLNDTDNLPVLDNSHGTVYYGYDGDVLTYSNSPLTPPTIDNVAYIDANGQPQTADNVTVITDSPVTPVTWGAAGQTTWYVVQGLTLTSGAVCYGDVHLILADDASLFVGSGIQVSGNGNSLTIYGQTAQSGILAAEGGESAAGIGGGHDGDGSYITINGGKVTAEGGTNSAGIGGGNQGGGSYITINGGTVTAKGGTNAAGIGGGNEGFGSNITINGGTITATGGNEAAGIGGGYYGSGTNITINGGKVTANGGNNGPGIGGGSLGSECSNITINNGEVTANGGQLRGAGIGGGALCHHCFNINITGGKVTATAAATGGGAGIGLDADGSMSFDSCHDIYITGGEVTASGAAGVSAIGCRQGNATVSNIFVAAPLTIRADNNNPPTTIIAAARNSDTDITNDLGGRRYAKIEIGQTKTITYGDYISVSPQFESGAAIKEGIAITFTAADRWDDYYEFLGFYKESTFSTPITEGVSGNVYTVTVMDDDISVYAKYEEFTPAFYIDADGQQKIAKATEITNSSSTLNAGWYVVTGDNVSTGTLVCSGDVHLILADGAKLTATGNNDLHTPGIQVSGEGNSLTIYGQTAQSGQLIATGGTNAAGIGGGKYGSGSNITINGCKVTANGGDCGAGIGGGQHGSGSNITIKGGTVTATGGKSAAGIGGGDDGSGSNITINGGVVTATGGSEAAGIGGGWDSSCSNITITGGKVTATGGNDGSGIGVGSIGSYSNIFVAAELTVAADNNNPPTTVIAHTTTTDIASNLNGKRYAFVGTPQGGIVTYGEFITVSPAFASGDHIAACTQVTFTADDRWTDNHEFIGFYKESTFNTPITVGVSGRVYTTTVVDSDLSVYAKYEPFTPIPYIDADGQQKSVKATEITNETSTLSAGWYVVAGNDVQTGTLTCNGDVHLILADGAKLTATGINDSQIPGIQVSGEGNSLAIYGQANQSGRLIANGGLYAAGIGGGYYSSGSNITINGGTITANGGHHGAGIGGGFNGSGSNITINGGTITATGGDNAAGIGGGYYSSGSNITINGGTITANGGYHGAGIGGGYNGSGSNITINGGTITATGGDTAAGIGGGQNGSGSNITINGGTVTANGGRNAAGIGGGEGGSGSNIKVATALTVYADNTTPPANEILHTDNDIASYIAALRYVIVKDEMTNVKNEAIAAINAAIEGVTNEDIIAIATNAIDAINTAINQHEIEALKEQALAAIAALKSAYASGLGEMGVPCDDCPAVDVTKGTTTIRLYSPEKVEFKKTE